MMNRVMHYQKWFALIFLCGFFVKYNYLAVAIYQVPSLLGLTLKNVVFLLVFGFYGLPLTQNRRSRFAVFLFFLTFSLFFLANVWYNRYFGNYLSLSDVLMGQGIRPYKVLIRQLLRWYDAVFILDLLLMAVCVLRDKPSISIRAAYNRFPAARRKSTALIIACVLAVQILTTNFLVGINSPLSLYKKSTPFFVNVYGISLLYVFEYVSFFHHVQEDVQSELPATHKELAETEMTKNTPGISNVIVIQVESLDEKIIGHTHNGIEVTPFLNRLKNSSLYFPNFYAQHVNGSFDAEFSFMTSIYPINKNYGFRMNDLSQFTSLVEILNDKGYTTLAFHGNDKEFFHRHKAFPELGFDRSYFKEYFSLEDATKQGHFSTFGINDYDFFLQSCDFLEEADQPFFAFFITVTSHTPFDFYPFDSGHQRFQDVNKPIVQDYFRSISFVDKALEMFFKQLKERNLYQSS